MIIGIPNKSYSQQAFNCEGQIFAIDKESYNISQLFIDPSNNSVRILDLFATNVFIDPFGFRSSDRLLYGIDPVNYQLYRIDASGDINLLTTLQLNNNYTLTAGAISNDGQYFYVIGSNNLEDKVLYRIDLDNYNLLELLSFGAQTSIRDLAFDPYTDKLYGCDNTSNAIIEIKINQGLVVVINELKKEDKLQGIYFDAFGKLIGFGTTANGVATGLFDIGITEAKYSRISTGPFDEIIDLASCPFTVGIKNASSPAITFPCSDILYEFTIANPSSHTYNNIDFECRLPEGLRFVDFETKPTTGNIGGRGSPIIRVSDMSVGTGIRNFTARIHVDDVPKGFYKSQATMTGFPSDIGAVKISDDPNTASFKDSTKVQVNRLDESELSFSRLLCLDDPIVLDASQFGGNINWVGGGGNGATLEVSEPGLYVFTIDSGCQELEVSYDVVGASCPYVIELGLLTIPQESFPCSEVIYRYIFENDSGLKREGISLIDSLDSGFEFVELLTPLKSGILESVFPSDKLLVSGIDLEVGFDTLEFRVAIGDITPGTYHNRAELTGFHPLIGIKRSSDDPRTQLFDSTKLIVKGTLSDSTFKALEICQNEELLLKGNEFGIHLMWENGSQDSVYRIDSPGIYELLVFDGCEDSYVFFEVHAASDIQIDYPNPILPIHVGDSIWLQPEINNQGEVLEVSWYDPFPPSLRCDSCLSSYARPYNTAEYIVYASNEKCKDSLNIVVEVDKTRRVYFPTIFSPDSDGINDCFLIHSPDHAYLRQFVIYDRWGGIRYRTDGDLLEEAICWNGYENGHIVAAGVYSYLIEIEFIDGESEIFSGTVTLVR